jgi:type II secretory pathway pseudopilin PulG
MRKGYLLIELVVVLSVLALLTVTFGRLWRTFIFEIPRDYRLIQQSSILNDAVNHIRADIASAKAISQSSGDSLLMETSDGVITYKFENGRILRQKNDTDKSSILWSAPQGRIEWRVRDREKKGYAVEVTTYIEDNDLGHKQRKMSNSFLFFTGTIWETAK